ncbi:MAG TPA: guanylate kinase [Gemmataceae bacterium]|nr:guanylate kinase [Gemmataceae bacterium]
MLAPLFILSGPSGSGKSTLLRRLLAEPEPPLRLSVSATTRQPRNKEQDGVHYHFWTRERFEGAVKADAFLEWADVFGNFYGTLRSEVEPFRQQGIGVFLDIDVQGAAQVRQNCPDAVTIFLRASSLEVYEQRLRGRGTETEAAIQRRLDGARRELARVGEYQYTVINDDLDTAVAELRAIVRRHFERNKNAG